MAVKKDAKWRMDLAGENLGIAYSVVKALNIPDSNLRDEMGGVSQLALCEAARVWKPGIAKFSTFAWQCCRNAVLAALIRERKVAAQRAPLNDEVDGAWQPEEEPFAVVGLTEREEVICRMLIEGYSKKSIAKKFKVDGARITMWCGRIRRKMDTT